MKQKRIHTFRLFLISVIDTVWTMGTKALVGVSLLLT